MLPFPDRSELARRLPRLVVGLMMFGVGLAFMVVAGLGLAPWEVLHQGISETTPLTIGQAGIATGFLVLLGWVPLRERFGLGTVLNVLIIGVVLDLTLLVLPESVGGLPAAWGAMVLGLLLIAVGSGFYIGAGMGPGPRDGLMTGLARRGLPVGAVRFAIEVTVLVAGWALGGTVGVGTAFFAFGIGPLVHVALDRLSLPPVPVSETGNA